MPALRNRSVGTKVTDQEYAALEAAAGGQRVSEWVRQVLLAAATQDSADRVILAEVLALRTIVLNLQFATATGQTPTVEAMQGLIDRADREKFSKAKDRLARQSVTKQL